MTTIAIMQPTYLPWIGYFALMERVDTFVFLDSVQFDRRSWQQRNRIKAAEGVLTLTIPVINKGLREQLIKDVKIDPSSNFVRKHIGTISRSYSKAQFYSEFRDCIFGVMESNFESLSDLNIALILKIKEILGIECNILKSSEMNVGGAKADLLAGISKKLSADKYISPLGSMEYLEESTAFKDRNIDVGYNHFEHPTYKQLNGEFVSHLSVIDLIFNEGPQSLQLIRDGIVKGGAFEARP